MASCLTDLFSGRCRATGSSTSPGSRSRPRPRRGRAPTRAAGYLYGQLSHLLGLGLWLVPDEPEEVFARAHLLENGVDLDIQVSVASRGRRDRLLQRPRPPALGAGATPATSGSPAKTACSCSTSTACRRSSCSRATRSRPRWLTSRMPPPVDDDWDLHAATGPPSSSSTPASVVTTVNRAPSDLGVRTVAVMEAAWKSVHSARSVRVAELSARG